MKLTWFGGTTVRIHIGGQIVVVDPSGAPAGIDAAELVSGADHILPGFGQALPAVDTASWKPRKPVRLLDEEPGETAADCWSAGPGAMLIDAMGEPPLLLTADAVPTLGRWADSAVIALFGDAATLIRLGQAVLAARPPRLIMLAGNDAAVDAAIAALREHLDGTGLVALEAGLALEA